MHNLPKMFAFLLITFLSSCQSVPDVMVTRQRFVHFVYIEINGEKFIDPKASQCLEREYKYSIEFLGPVEKFRPVSLDLCNKLTGNSPGDYVRVFQYQDDVRKEIQNHDDN